MLSLLIKNEMKKEILNVIFLLINNNSKQIFGLLSQHINGKKIFFYDLPYFEVIYYIIYYFYNSFLFPQ